MSTRVPYTQYVILPQDYEGHLSYEDIFITIHASTTEDEYRCRERDTDRESIYVEDSDGWRIYADLSSRDRYTEYMELQGGTMEPSDRVHKDVGESIVDRYFRILCPYGKYPSVECLSENAQLIYEEFDTDKNRGEIDSQYRIRIHLHNGDFCDFSEDNSSEDDSSEDI